MRDQESIGTETTPEAAAGCCGRRDALRLAGVGVVGAAALSACGSTDAGTTATGIVSSATAQAGEVAGKVIASADIPIGGGKVFDSLQVVVTQPTQGQFKAFSAVCPHQGCLVTEVTGGNIICPCHGSQFNMSTGEVTAGPANTGLPAKSVSVSDKGITVS
jgi:nitrite reductase/ring-hydroxylating ferredoxin subunit